MPGIYSKPPRRTEFASDISCLIQGATERLSSGDDWSAYVYTLVDEIETERVKARQEISAEGEALGGQANFNDSDARRAQQLVARKEIEIAEVFFECGVHDFFCKVLEKPDDSLRPAVFEQILGVYQVFQLIDVDPFDDDMGLVSLLNYFLSERHSYYIDIHWRENELSHMPRFLVAMIRFISFSFSNDGPSRLSRSTASDSSTEDDDIHKNEDSWRPLQVAAARLLHTTLWTFPPHRVVSRMAFSFTRSSCSGLFRSFSQALADSIFPDEQLLQLQAEVIAAVAFFGVGPSLSRKAVSAAFAWSCNSFACRDERCPCSMCEFQRRLLKLVRNRDELGVQSSTESKRQICYALVRAGVTEFIEEALLATTAAWRQAGFASPKSSSSATSSTFQAIAWIMMLCSWAYEEVNQGQSILSANGMRLMTLATDALEAVYTDSPDFELFSGDEASTLLRVVVCLVLRSRVAERRTLMMGAKPTFVKITSWLCRRLTELSTTTHSTTVTQEQRADAGSGRASTSTPSTVSASDTSLDPQERALTTSLVLFSLMELIFDSDVAPDSTTSGSEVKEEPKVAPSTIRLAMQACQSLIDIYEYLHPRFANLKEASGTEQAEPVHELSVVRVPEEGAGQAGFKPREFFLGILGTMAILMGGLALQGVEQKRWRFIANPAAEIEPANAGGFAFSARSMLSHYKNAEEECCQIVKKLGGLVILRSEQAAAMVLRATKAP